MAAFVNKPWHRPKQWSREGMANNVFLDPTHRKYPVRRTSNGPYYVRALVAAAHYSKMYGDKTVYKKATALLDEYKRKRTTSHTAGRKKRRKKT